MEHSQFDKRSMRKSCQWRVSGRERKGLGRRRQAAAGRFDEKSLTKGDGRKDEV